MSVWTLFAVGIAGGVGSALRFALDQTVTRRFRSRFPLGILLVNLSGSFALGLLTGATIHGMSSWLDERLLMVLGLGLLGGYTTFSTVTYDTARLILSRRSLAAIMNGAGTLVGAVSLAVIGLSLTAR